MRGGRVLTVDAESRPEVRRDRFVGVCAVSLYLPRAEAASHSVVNIPRHQTVEGGAYTKPVSLSFRQDVQLAHAETRQYVTASRSVTGTNYQLTS